MACYPYKFINVSEGSFPQCLFLLFDPGFAFLSFARRAVEPGHTNEKCKASSANRFLKCVHLCYLCTRTLLKEPLDWKHSTGKRNESSHPIRASSLLLWGTTIGNKNLSLAERRTSGGMELFWHKVFITKWLVSPCHNSFPHVTFYS